MQTATRGTPVLCAACHSDNALGFAGLPGSGRKPATCTPSMDPDLAIERSHARSKQRDQRCRAPAIFVTRAETTKCKRGAMNRHIVFRSCHGNLSLHRNGVARTLDHRTACQMCHNTSQRFTTTFDDSGQWRQTTDRTFATNDNVPVPGANLYRFSTGHGGVFCSACHGSPHAEYPSLDANDNVAPIALQGYAAKITECSVCHTSGLTTNTLDGPHGIHTVGQSWVTDHHDYVDHHGYQACAYCHGADYRGLPLSATKVARTFRIEDGRQRSFPADHQFSCYDCHNGPGGDSPSGKGREQVRTTSATVRR